MSERLGHCTPVLGGHSPACQRDGSYCSMNSTHDGPCQPHGRKEPMTDQSYAPSDEWLARFLDADEIPAAIEYQTKARRQTDVTDQSACIGCWLGDDGPLMHDYGFGCIYGKGAGY